MTEEQRRKAAAQRCADLANARERKGYTANNFMEHFGPWEAALNAVLELDELARILTVFAASLPEDMADKMRSHILPEPKLSPVERLADGWGLSPSVMQAKLDDLGLQLVERKS